MRYLNVIGHWKLVFIALFCQYLSATAYEVIYAVNCGGPAHIDVNGIKYEEDPLHGIVGTTSHSAVHNYFGPDVAVEDAILYETERYHSETFGYNLPLAGEGNYLLVLKFAEVYFHAPNRKVFDITLNEEHVIVSELDIFKQVGHMTAYEEQIPFSISRGKLFVNNGEVSEVRSSRVKVQFVKGPFDNPKIHAIVLVKGADAEAKFPKLSHRFGDQFNGMSSGDSAAPDQPLERSGKSMDGYPHMEEPKERQRKTSGPKQPNPYEDQNSLVTIVIFIATATLIPLSILRCRL